ncbi:MAG: carboxypeptidase-like regulatory domain-containing protein, partial [Parabacteroides sp.]|nr:carboxypeptidase-like regulatory domain-containing protein [Parabacteroides sp.]
MRNFYQLIVGSSLLLTSIPLSAQKLAVSGTVVDNTGFGMPGVSVSIKGKTVGTITDLDGKYVLDVDKGETLVFSFVGYKPQEVIISQSVVNVTLAVSTVGLDEVVVVGYGTQSRRTVTSAISKVDGEVLKNVPISTVGEGLKGK